MIKKIDFLRQRILISCKNESWKWNDFSHKTVFPCFLKQMTVSLFAQQHDLEYKQFEFYVVQVHLKIMIRILLSF